MLRWEFSFFSTEKKFYNFITRLQSIRPIFYIDRHAGNIIEQLSSPCLRKGRGFLSLEVNNAALAACDVHVFLPHGDGFAVGEDDGGNQRFALRLDVRTCSQSS